jgi:hypothetical protein
VDTFVDVIVDLWNFDHAAAVFIALTAIWYSCLTVMLVTKAVEGAIGATRQVHSWMRESGRLTRADAPTPDLGTEPPALVNLLYTHGKISREAVRATVLDLAARGAVTLYQPDHDPAATVIMSVRDLAAELTADLTPYERRVFDELRAAGKGARLSEVPALRPTGARRWHRRFRREVQADARERGLTYLDTSIIAKIVAATFVPCSVISLFAGFGVIVVLVYVVAMFVVGERSRVWLSPNGRETLARWLGVRAWLEAHEVLADLPPASVAVWGRYVAYGAALDVVKATPATRMAGSAGYL